MQIKDREKIEIVLEKIKNTQAYKSYQESYQKLVGNNEALNFIEEYKQAKQAYTDFVLDYSDTSKKEKMQKELYNKKLLLNQFPMINEYFLSARVMELFIDDLNYDINQIVGKSKKHKHHNKNVR